MIETYHNRAKTFAQEEQEALGQSDRLSSWRLGAFVSAVGLIFLANGLWHEQPVRLLVCYCLAVCCMAAFVLLVFRHQRIDERQRRLGLLRTINLHGAHRLERDWAQFPPMQAPYKFQNLTIARDLNLFGTGSLFHLLCTGPTLQGRHTLAQWLIEPSPQITFSERHECVRELAPLLDWRQELQAKGQALADQSADDDPILAWVSQEPWLMQKPWLITATRLLPFGLLAIVTLGLAKVIQGPWWLMALLVHWIVTRWYRRSLDTSLGHLSQQEKALRHYACVFQHVHGLGATGATLRELKDTLNVASLGMARLSHLATQADTRGSIVHPLLQYLLLWDFHTVRAIEQWQEQHGRQVSAWFHALGELEALASLANLHQEEPDWAFSKLADTSNTFTGEHLAHPLIAGRVRVGNDVHLGPGGHFMLITGSNMSGKSTLLRSIGLNTTLANAGAPVCAKSLELSSFQLATSLHVNDSLTDGISFFMAELKRIQQVVQMANAAADNPNARTVLYLLDEILQGTNSEERQVIVKRVLAHLVKQGAIGAVTTHDLALADLDIFSETRQLDHFREEFRETSEGPQMTFDYILRQGVATSTNAVKLLEIIDLKI